MDEIQACILNFRFKNLEKISLDRQKNAELYMRLLDKQKIYFPPHRDYAKNFILFVIQVENEMN